MGQQTAAARFLLTTTLFLAIAGDTLLRGGPWGAGFSLLSILLFGALALLAHRVQSPVPREAWIFAGLGVVTAACVSWRDSPSLAFFNVLATLGAAALVTARKRPGDLFRMTFLDHFQQLLVHTFHASTGFGFLLLRDLRALPGEGGTGGNRWGRIWLGIALAVPVLIVFGSLLTSADATFEYLIREVFQIDFWTIMGHAALIVFLSWVIGGLLRGRYLVDETVFTIDLRPKALSLEITEVAIVLGALDLLFSTFVAVQFSYFFGGHSAVLGTPSLTYAEYARRGFFELIAVAFLSLPLLLTADWLLRSDDRRGIRLFRALAIVMVTLLGVMLASGVHRLWLYMDAYGLTTPRVNAAAILLWVGVTLVLFCATVLRGKRNLLPFGVAVSGFVILIGLNAVNPDALVARVNLARMAKDTNFDVNTTIRLSADAVPSLLEGIPGLESGHRSALAERLVNRYGSRREGRDIRSWNADRNRADALVRERESALKAYILPDRKPEAEER